MPNLDDLTESIHASWFVPLFKVTRGDKPKRILFKKWFAYANYADWYGDTWCKPIESFILVPGGGTKKTARMATTMILWLASNHGRNFISDILKKTKPRSFFCEENILSAWSYANKRSRYVNGGKRTAEIIFDEYPLSSVGYEIAEQVLLWIISEEGRQFLAEAYREIGWDVSWEY